MLIVLSTDYAKKIKQNGKKLRLNQVGKTWNIYDKRNAFNSREKEAILVAKLI